MFLQHTGRCSDRTSLQRCALQPTLVMLPSARWRAGGLLPLAQEAVSEGCTGPNPAVGTHFFPPIRLVASLLHSVCSRLRAKNVVIRSYEGPNPAWSFASMNSWWYALLALGLVAWVLQPEPGLFAAATLPATAVRQNRPKSLNIGAMLMNMWVEFMNMRVKFMNSWVKFMNMRVKFMNMRAEFMNMRAMFMSTRVACMNSRACAMRVAAPCADGRTTRRSWPMQARGPPLPGELIPAPCGAFPRPFL